MRQHLFILPSPFSNMVPNDRNTSAASVPRNAPDPIGPSIFQQALRRNWGRDSCQESQATSRQQRDVVLQQHNEGLKNMIREDHEESRGDRAFPATIAKPQDSLKNDEDEWERSFVGSSATVAPSEQGSTRMDELIRSYGQSLPTAAVLTQVVTKCADDEIFGSSKR